MLKSSDRNKASSFRKAMALMFALIRNEASIKNHHAQVIALTDCIGLSQILRSSNNNSKPLEYAIYLSTFSNLSVRYSVGSSLCLADLLTREIVRNGGGLCGSQGDNVGRNIGNGALDLSTEFGQNDLLIVRIRWRVSGYQEMLRTVVGYVAIKVKMLEEIWDIRL